MAKHPSALKRQRQAEKRRARYRDRQANILELTKKLISSPSKAEATQLLKTVQSKLAKFSQKGRMHQKTAARKTARLFKLVAGKK